MGDNLPYDLLVDNGEQIHRIQVKTTQTTDPGGNGRDRSRYSFTLKHRANSETYQLGAIDYFGFVVLPLCIIYIVPFDKVGGRSKASVYPSNSTSIGRFERYKQAWFLLKSGHKRGKTGRNVGIGEELVPRRGLEPPRGCPH